MPAVAWWRHDRTPTGLDPAALAIAVAVIVVLVGLLALRSAQGTWGSPAERVASPTGEYEVVQYEWTAMIDPGWNLAIERVGG